MASSIPKNQVIPYPPEILKTFHVTSYEWIDNLHFIQDPLNYVADVEPYLELRKQSSWKLDGMELEKLG